jgi:phage/plasmid-associated DNA primase
VIRDKTLVADLAALITMHDSFARDVSGKLFRYQGGVYVDGEFFLRQRVKHLLVEFQKSGRWTRKLADEVREFLLLDAPEVLTRPSPDILNLENGLLDIQAMELRPHSPAFRSTLRIPVCFRPLQTCPRIDRFLEEVFPEVELAWEILGDLVTTDRSIQKAICLVGEGGNGKGVFSQLATNFAGAENVAHLSLQRLENDRFAVARLQGKLANICPDLPAERLTDSSIFKAITGCDRITEKHFRRINGHANLWALAAILGSENKSTTQPSKEKVA